MPTTRRIPIPPVRADRMYAVRDAARPHDIIPTRSYDNGDVIALVEIDDVDSVIARVPAFAGWVATATDLGARREMAGRTWALVRFHAVSGEYPRLG